jgi:hypothetical protein
MSTSHDSADLIKALYVYDCSNINSAKQNEEYWKLIAQKQDKDQADMAKDILSRIQQKNIEIQQKKMEIIMSKCIGSCSTTGCTTPNGQFGSKCSCGTYRTKFI